MVQCILILQTEYKPTKHDSGMMLDQENYCLEQIIRAFFITKCHKLLQHARQLLSVDYMDSIGMYLTHTMLENEPGYAEHIAAVMCAATQSKPTSDFILFFIDILCIVSSLLV